ncbi:MAG: ECF transporter S component [Clostridia bacterium]|nr:ECF transporter S component [Clostridia bacterium]
MTKTGSTHKLSIAKQIAFTAAFAALCMLGTILVSVPLPASGYFNVGDVFVLLSGWCLGPVFGFTAAAIGSALADVLTGYALYAPATFLIKGLDALAAWFVWSLAKKAIKKSSLDFLPRIAGAIVGEVLMTALYFFFESVILGLGLGALPNIAGNALQGACCAALAVAIVSALYPLKPVGQFFPHLRK